MKARRDASGWQQPLLRSVCCNSVDRVSALATGPIVSLSPEPMKMGLPLNATGVSGMIVLNPSGYSWQPALHDTLLQTIMASSLRRVRVMVQVLRDVNAKESVHAFPTLLQLLAQKITRRRKLGRSKKRNPSRSLIKSRMGILQYINHELQIQPYKQVVLISMLF